MIQLYSDKHSTLHCLYSSKLCIINYSRVDFLYLKKNMKEPALHSSKSPQLGGVPVNPTEHLQEKEPAVLEHDPYVLIKKLIDIFFHKKWHDRFITLPLKALSDVCNFLQLLVKICLVQARMTMISSTLIIK